MLDILVDTIKAIASFFHSIYIVIDGLDECSKREDLLHLVLGLATEAETVNVAVVSRPEIDIQRAFSGRSNLGIDDFVHADISVYIEWRLEHDVKLSRINANLKHDIKEKLLAKNAGM